MSSLEEKQGLGFDGSNNNGIGDDDVPTVISQQATVRVSNVAAATAVTVVPIVVDDEDGRSDAAVVLDAPPLRSSVVNGRLADVAIQNARLVLENTYLSAQHATARDEATFYRRTAERHRNTIERLYRQACDLRTMRQEKEERGRTGGAEESKGEGLPDLDRKRAASAPFPSLKELTDENQQQQQLIQEQRRTIEHLRRQVSWRDRRHELTEEIHDLEKGIEDALSSWVSAVDLDADAAEAALVEQAVTRAEFAELIEQWQRELREVEGRLVSPYSDVAAAAAPIDNMDDDSFSLWSGGSVDGGGDWDGDGRTMTQPPTAASGSAAAK